MALGDKIVNLDDLKVVGDAVTDLKSAVAINVGEITKPINVPQAGGSVWFDAYLVAGAKYVFTNNTTVSCSLKAQKSDGTSTTLKSEVSANSSYTFTAGDNYVKIGGWFNASGSITLSGNIGLATIKANATALQNAFENSTGNEIIEFINGKYIPTNGTNVDYNTLIDGSSINNVAVVDAVEGDKFTINGTGASSGRLWCFCKANGDVIKNAGIGAVGVDMVLTAPANSAKLVLNIINTVGVCFRGTSRNNTVSAMQINQITYDTLQNATGYKRTNYLTDITTTTGKYVNYQTGNLEDNADYSVTEYFPVYPGAVYELYYYSPGSQIAYYDYDKTYIGGSMANARNFTVPDNQAIKFARWCGETSRQANWQLYLANIVTDGIKTITTSEGLLAGIKDAYAKGNKSIIVQPGTYNVITEYTNYYGSTYFSAYADNYNGEINGAFDRGLWLDSVNITFQPGAIVEAKYTGNNEYVKTYFSAFAVGTNVTIDGLVLDAENLRYGIHPDFHPNSNPDTLVVKNCDLHHYKANASDLYNANQAIGAGLGVHSAWTFENCIFRSDTSYPVFRIHNNASSSAKSNIIIKDCYIVGNGFIRLNSYSTSTEQTTALVTGCSWVNPAVVGKETQSSTDNITMYSWGNETRD